MTTPKKMGRPPGKDYPVHRTMLLTETDNERLEQMAASWACSVAEAVRRLIREEGKRLDRAERRKSDEGTKGGHVAALN